MLKRRTFIRKEAKPVPVKKKLIEKDSPKKSFLSYVNIFFSILIIFEVFGMIACNTDYLYSKMLPTANTLQNAYQNISIGFQVEKHYFIAQRILTPTAIPTKQPAKSPTPTVQPTNTPLPTSAFFSEPTFIPTLTPTPTQKPSLTPIKIPTPTPDVPLAVDPLKPITQNFDSELSQQPINYYALGEQSLFGSNTKPMTSFALLAKKDTTYNVSKFAGGNIKNVFVIVMENSNWSDIMGNIDAAPYINERLLPQASYANNYYNPVGLHPSEPNYIWLEAGSNINIGGRRFTTDDDPSFINSSDTSFHLTTLLNKKHISWKTYLENIDGTTCPVNSYGLYAVKHNPMAFFQDVFTNKSYCMTHERPMAELQTDLENNTTAQYTFIVPNLCNDMHDDCNPLHNKIKQGDKWLSLMIPHILDSQAYKSSGLILITWDEGEQGKDGPIGLIALSPFVKGNGYSNEIYYTHSSTVKTIEEIFGIPYLRDSANATDLSDLFIDTDPDVSFSLSPISFASLSPYPTIFAKSFTK